MTSSVSPPSSPQVAAWHGKENSEVTHVEVPARGSKAESVNLELREQIWSGSVPCLFRMEQNEMMLSSMHKQPISIFLLLPRISYLPLVTQRVRSHFSMYAPALSDGMWFECTTNNVKHALKWNYPIGVLYDLYHHHACNENEHENENESESEDASQSPVWNLTVHFQSYPADDVMMKCDNINTVKHTFFNYLKQSVFLSYNNISGISSLTKSDQDTLWNGVHKADYNLYFPVYQSIFGRTKANKQALLRYPFRILLRGFNEDVDMIPIQRAINVEASKTLRECLEPIIPGVMQMYDRSKHDASSIAIIVHGMHVALHTPMIWLVRHAGYADCFLYVLVVKTNRATT